MLLCSLNSIEELIKFATRKKSEAKYLFGFTSAFASTRFHFFFFFKLQLLTILPWIVHRCTVHGSHKFHFSTIFSLKNDPTVLFTHLKIILLQCFQFSVFSKISCILTDPNSWLSMTYFLYFHLNSFREMSLKIIGQRVWGGEHSLIDDLFIYFE